jgi:hypothetical protein
MYYFIKYSKRTKQGLVPITENFIGDQAKLQRVIDRIKAENKTVFMEIYSAQLEKEVYHY